MMRVIMVLMGIVVLHRKIPGNADSVGTDYRIKVGSLPGFVFPLRKQFAVYVYPNTALLFGDFYVSLKGASAK